MPFVYALQSGDENRFKIGRTTGDPAARKKNLATGNPYGLTIVDQVETESEILCETYLKRLLRAHRCAAGDATEIFAITLEELHCAFEDAREFLREYLPVEQEAELLATAQSDGRVLTPGHHELEIYQRLLQIRQEEDRLRLEREFAESELKLAIGTADGLLGIATWKTREQKRFDQNTFKSAYPDLWENFSRVSRHRTFRLWKG
jgi:T5orf172 domain